MSALVGGLLIGSSSALFLVLNVAFWHGAEVDRTSVIVGTADLQTVKLKGRG
jgi:hypothetical protein